MNRSRLLSFAPATGVLDGAFAPTLDGEVQGIEPGPTAGTVYVMGGFKTVNGAAARGIALLSLANGSLVSTFKPAAIDGEVWDGRLVGTHLLLAGTFAHVGGVAHSGVGALNPTTGALDPYVSVQLTGHHNFTGGSGANGGVGAHRIAVSPNGARAVLVGNFKLAGGVVHDQVVQLSLGTSAATVVTGWNTAAFTAACLSGAYDSYVRDVDYSPDGSYFAIVATGGSGTNTDGTKALCDTASRWSSAGAGTNVRPTWVDYTGRDTLLSVAVTGTAVYVGGHQRWLNNSHANDTAGPGAVPRPGIAALDPTNGLRLSWNPGRNPRGAGAYALLATSTGLYVGSDTTFIGNRKYARWRIAFFPLAGGRAVPATSTGTLPGKVFVVGPRTGATSFANSVSSRTFTGTAAGAPVAVVDSSGTPWSSARGAFQVGHQLFFGRSDGKLYTRTFDGTAFGPASPVDPYADPAWSTVQTGSGQTYRGLAPGLYGTTMTKLTGTVWSGGRVYYSQNGQARLRSRWFTPDSGITGSDEVVAAGSVDFSNMAGMLLSGSTLYWVDANTGSLRPRAVPGALRYLVRTFDSKAQMA